MLVLKSAGIFQRREWYVEGSLAWSSRFQEYLYEGSR
jgi:hypothetical protein